MARVVLPGLDTDLDETSGALIAGNADDKTMMRARRRPSAIRHAGAAGAPRHRPRSDVKQLSDRAARPRAIGLRGAASGRQTERWQARTAKEDFAAATERAMASSAVIEAANAEEEALAIAVVLREALEASRQDRRAGNARPRARPPRRWRRWRAGTSRSTIRRRQSGRYAGRHLRAAGRAGGARRPRSR